ncbi:integral membrane protein mpv17 pmp22 family [Fusarium solani]|uniref:Integral membrane protein mpv17 pmp22 family n=1 Tax=Fusarium solani TaxID=169388 RepID=A0A9P9JSB8_FUSSL|nr:integral membrane protein mpv17 pmp22 family [Fusarium solani]KAH7230310.1 integral membrane protein mpv17 pmp22 family [Fusarium solani]
MAVSVFEIPPLVSVTLQNTVLAATSNLLAQVLMSYRVYQPLIIDWVPVTHFIIYTIISTPPPTTSEHPGNALKADSERIDWSLVLARTQAEFALILVAGWRLWPAVSLINFTFVKSVEGRNLVTGLAGVGWGIYMSLFAAE